MSSKWKGRQDNNRCYFKADEEHILVYKYFLKLMLDIIERSISTVITKWNDIGIAMTDLWDKHWHNYTLDVGIIEGIQKYINLVLPKIINQSPSTRNILKEYLVYR